MTVIQVAHDAVSGSDNTSNISNGQFQKNGLTEYACPVA
jgi:hypothetical protein